MIGNIISAVSRFSGIFKEKVKSALESHIRAGGSLVTEDHFQARVNVCKTRQSGRRCEYLGEVSALGLKFSEGCTKCGCPLSTKAWMLEIESKMLEGILQTGKEIRCPHPQGNMWEETDKNFANKYFVHNGTVQN